MGALMLGVSLNGVLILSLRVITMLIFGSTEIKDLTIFDEANELEFFNRNIMYFLNNIMFFLIASLFLIICAFGIFIVLNKNVVIFSLA